ncbi:MAG: hypothetical protein D6696_14980 [Acidobacteria bacterium]|nr:MAG: hypothetical protein D6696_14980 [Acidobacteriota bacterium]
MEKINPTDGHVIAGVKIDETRFLGRVRAAQLFQLAPDPRQTENRSLVEANRELREIQEIRQEVQRLFEGAKRRNVPSYAEYIAGLKSSQNGLTPPIILFSQQKLTVEDKEDGTALIQVPWGIKLVAIDGETQLAARFEARNIEPSTEDDFVAIMLCHGLSLEWARQAFHDLNMYGVKPNAAIAIGMDLRDPMTRIARYVERSVPFFKGRVNEVRRQLRRSDTDVVTIAALRGSCVTLATGIGGVKYGAKSVPSRAIPENTQDVAVEWFIAVTEMIGPAIEDRSRTVAAAPSVLAAIGAMGHDLVNIDPATRSESLRGQLNKLRSVDWSRGKHWEGIAGKFTPKGTFSIGGSKETSYAVYAALNDTTSKGYRRVRKQSGSAEAV